MRPEVAPALRLQLGVSLYYEGRLDEAAAELEAVRAEAQARGDAPLLLTAVGNIGNVHYVRGEWAEALSCYGQLLGDGIQPHTTTVLNNLGNTLARLGRAREAVSHFGRALDAARTLGARDQEAMTLRNLGACLYERRHFRRAIIFLERAEKLAEEIGFAFLLSWLWPYLGAAHVRAGSGGEALRIIDKGVALAVRQASREHQAEALCCRGDALAHLGEGELARAAYAEAGRIAAGAGIAPLVAWATRGDASAGAARGPAAR